jgi:hypothetical protein
MLKLALLLIAATTVGVWLHHRIRKLQALRTGELVNVSGAEVRYPNLPLKTYGIPVRVKDRNRTEIVFPRLTSEGDVEYVYSWHSFSDIKLVSFRSNQPQDDRVETAIELCKIIREHLQLDSELVALRKQHHEVNRLADLFSSSRVYSDQLDTYERAVQQLEILLDKATELQSIYVHLVREALIGIQISSYNPSNIRDNRLKYESQYQRLKQEFIQMQDTATAYRQLMQQH